MAATPETFPGFSAEQNTTIGRLAGALKLLGPLFLLLGVARLGLGVVEIIYGHWGGLLLLPEAGLWVFAGLACIAGAADAGYLKEVKGREKEHLLNTYTSIKVASTALLILACYVGFVYFCWMWA
jgi:hypothetical protein